MSKVIKVDDIDILKKVAYPRVINYTAKWCRPCLNIAPKIDKLANDNPTICFCKIDIDEHQEHTVQMNINSVPTFMLYRDILSEPVIIKGANFEQILVEITKLKEPKY
jgi:thioredoxin 1